MKILITILLVGLILKFVGFATLINAFKEANIYFFVLAFLFSPFFLFFKFIKWHKLVKEEIPDASFFASAKSFLAGWSVALLTPARVGELARALYFDSGSKLRLFSLVLFDKVFDFVALVFLSFVGFNMFLDGWQIFLFSFLGIAVLFAIFRQSLILAFLTKLSFILPFKSKIKHFLDGWKPVSSKTISLCLVYTFFAFFITFFQSFLLVNSFEPVQLKIVLLVFPLVVLSNIIPVSIGGFGVREGVAAILLSLFGVSKASAVNATFMLFFINTIIPGLIGALFISELKIRNKLEK